MMPWLLSFFCRRRPRQSEGKVCNKCLCTFWFRIFQQDKKQQDNKTEHGLSKSQDILVQTYKQISDTTLTRTTSTINYVQQHFVKTQEVRYLFFFFQFLLVACCLLNSCAKIPQNLLFKQINRQQFLVVCCTCINTYIVVVVEVVVVIIVAIILQYRVS